MQKNLEENQRHFKNNTKEGWNKWKDKLLLSGKIESFKEVNLSQLSCKGFALPDVRTNYKAGTIKIFLVQEKLIDQQNEKRESLDSLCGYDLWVSENLVYKKESQDFPGCPVVKASPSNAEGVGSSLMGELGSHMPQGQKPKQKTEAVL